MFVRLLCLLLFALNLGAAAWLLFGREPVPAPPPRTDPGVAELKLLSEAPHGVATSRAAPLASERCTTLGPFDTDVDMRAAMRALSPHVARIQFHVEQVSASHGFRVFLPAAPTREAALQEARKLAAKGIGDYYVVTVGDQQNTVSLGLFNDRVNADKRQQEVAQQGFSPKVEQRVDNEPAWWLDYAVPVASRFQWQAWLPGRNDLKPRSIGCF